MSSTHRLEYKQAFLRVVFAAGLKPCESDKQKISVNAQIKVIYGGI
jgi:hypothetical protein